MYRGAGAMKLIPEIAEKLDNLPLWEAIKPQSPVAPLEWPRVLSRASVLGCLSNLLQTVDLIPSTKKEST